VRRSVAKRRHCRSLRCRSRALALTDHHRDRDSRSDGLGPSDPRQGGLSWLIGAWLLFQTTQAPALGLGELRTQSALNQPFYGQISLLDVSVSELDTVKASLASRSAFEKAGIERPHALTRLQFTPMIGPQGEPMIQVITREPVREPYLDLLVEVIWPGGRLVKEFTVLLDPPAVGAQRAVRAAPTGRRQSAQSPLVAAAESAGSSPAAARAGASGSAASPPPASSIAPQPTPVQAAVEAEVLVDVQIPPGAAAIDFPLRYGPVPSGAGLAMIARRLTPPAATFEQTALALYRNSQDAFIDGDINRLRRGAELVIPTAAELFALAPPAAREQYRAALAGRPVAQRPLTDVDARLSIATLQSDELATVDGGTVEEALIEVETIDEADSQAADPSPTSAALEAELLLMREASEANRQEATELRVRVQELEAQLDDIRRLLELRNEQLAQLAVGDNGLAEAEVASEAVTEAEVDLGSQGQSEPTSEPVLPQRSADEPEAAAEAAEDDGSVAASPAADFSLLGTLNGWLKAIQSWALPALGLGLVGLLLGLLLYRRRQQGAGAKPEEPGPLVPTPDAAEEAAADELRLDSDWMLRASPPAPQYTPEASVLAHDDPMAAEFEPLHPEAPATEIELAAGVAPEVPPLAETAETAEAPRRPGDLETAESTDIAEIPEAADSPRGAEDQAAEADDDDELFLDLDELERMSDTSERDHSRVDTPTAVVLEHQQTDEEQRLELDLAALDAMTQGDAADGWPVASQADAAGVDHRLAVSTRDALEPPPETDEAGTEAELPELPVLDPFDEGASMPSRSPADGPSGAEETLIATSVSEDSTEQAEATSRQQAPDATAIDDVPDRGRNEAVGEPWDDIGLKLDLARAYLDMGDADAASTILKEVIAEGREEQRREAESLLVGLDS